MHWVSSLSEVKSRDIILKNKTKQKSNQIKTIYSFNTGFYKFLYILTIIKWLNIYNRNHLLGIGDL